jgi:hypothetical protein
VDREVDLRVRPQEGLRLVGNVGAAENDHDTRLQRLQPAGNLERDAAIPDVGAEADEIGVLQRLDGVGDAHALVERRQKPVPARVVGHLLHVGLQQQATE